MWYIGESELHDNISDALSNTTKNTNIHQINISNEDLGLYYEFELCPKCKIQFISPQLVFPQLKVITTDVLAPMTPPVDNMSPIYISPVLDSHWGDQEYQEDIEKEHVAEPKKRKLNFRENLIRQYQISNQIEEIQD